MADEKDLTTPDENPESDVEEISLDELDEIASGARPTLMPKRTSVKK